MTPLLRRAVAAFVVFHVVSVVVLSIPRPPPGLRRADQHDPATERTLGRLAQAAEGLGFDRDRVVAFAHAWVPVWNGLLGGIRAPFEPYAAVTGAQQSWLMFGSVPTTSARLEIDARVDGAWVPLYRSQSAAHAWNARLLRQERMRAEIHRYTRRGHRVGLRALVDRLAAGHGPPVPFGRAPPPPGDRLRVQLRTVSIPDPRTLTERGLREGPAYWTEERPL